MNEYAEPHFDDERTLLSARPVVPLEKIEAKARHRRQWFLGGAFAIAMMLGAASALVASYLKLRNAPQAAAAEQSIEPDVAPPPVAVAESTPSDSPIDETPVAENVEETPAVTPKRESPKHRVATVRPDPEASEDRDARNPNESEQLDQIREAVLYDEWQERRARRAARRERRRAERYNHRDLSNLDEIFEGRRRP